MSCASGCYEATVETCNDIIIRAGFPADYPLYWLVRKTSSNNIHQRLAYTNGDGDLTIDKTDLPAGFLIKGANYKIQVKNGTNYLQPVNFTFGGTQYSCIMVSLGSFDRAEEDDSEVNVIQFTGTVEPEDPNTPNPYLIPVTSNPDDDFDDFTDATHVDLPAIVGKSLVIFWNNANRYLLPTEWAATIEGINITAIGFDAVANPDTYILIYIIN